MKTTFFILIDGPMGSGKSTIAALLHKQLKNAAYLGVDRIKWFVSDFNRTIAYNNTAHDVVKSMCDAYLKNGVNIILAQGLYSRDAIEDYLKIARKHRCKIFAYMLTASQTDLLRRLKTRKVNPAALKKSLSQSAVMRNLKSHAKIERKGFKEINTAHFKQKAAVAIILKDLKST